MIMPFNILVETEAGQKDQMKRRKVGGFQRISFVNKATEVVKNDSRHRKLCVSQTHGLDSPKKVPINEKTVCGAKYLIFLAKSRLYCAV